MKSYLNYLIKSKWLQTIIMTIIPTFIFMLTILLSTNDTHDFGASVVLINIVLVIIVILRFSSLRNAKEIDLYYALPISRKKLFLSHFIHGFIQLMIVWSVMFIIGFIMMILLTSSYQLMFLILLYLIVIMYLAIFYIITTFLFLKANTIFDGITFIILFQVFFIFLSTLFTNDYLRRLGFPEPFFLNPFYSITNWTTFLTNIMKPRPSGFFTDHFYEITRYQIINTITYLIMAGAAFIHIYTYNDKIKIEKIGQLSDTKLGYRMYISILLVVMIPSFFFVETAVTYLLLGIITSAGFIGLFIFRRSAKITLIDALFVIIPTIIGIVFGILINR